MHYICNMDELAKRVMAVLAYSGLNRNDFAKKTDVSLAVFSHITSGRNKPGLELILNILKEFPEVNASWLMLGNGEMVTTETSLIDKAKLLEVINELELTNRLFYNSLNDKIKRLQSEVKSFDTP